MLENELTALASRIVRKTRALGQHMLVDRRVLAKIVQAADIGSDETVCEAGTGQGVLTEELCKHAKRVMSYEIDRELYRKAKTLPFSKLELVNADPFRTENLNFDVFVSNLPYSRSRDALEWLAVQKFKRAIVMVQQEFADKLAAKPGEKNYRAISALSGHCFRMEKLFRVGRNSFKPPPSVESVVIRIVPMNTATRQTVKNLNLLFSQKNKKASSVAARTGVNADFGSKRVNQLAADELVMLAGSMQDVRPR